MGIVGVVGCIGSGKGAVSDFLVNQKGYIKMSFADPVKDAGSAIFGWDRKMLQGDTEESRQWREQPDKFWSNVMGQKFSPRMALQQIGTEVGRNYFHPDIWLRSLEARYNRSVSEGIKNIVVDDCRFPNEIEFIHNMGGHLLLVMRGEKPEWYDTAYKQNSGMKIERSEMMEVKYKNIHPSEWSWVSQRTLDIGDIIQNDGTLEELHEKVNDVLTQYL